MHQGNEAHNLLKDSLASQSSNHNLNLRAYPELGIEGWSVVAQSAHVMPPTIP